MGARWTPEEDQVVRENYPVHGGSWDGWERLLPGRTSEAIRVHAFKLGAVAPARRDPWTYDEDMVVCERYPEVGSSSPEWAELLPNRTPDANRRRANKLGLRYRGPIERWTDDELRALRENVGRGMGWDGWRTVLPKRTRHSIYVKSVREGLLETSHRSYTQREDEQLAEVLELVSERMGRPVSHVANRMAFLAGVRR